MLTWGCMHPVCFPTRLPQELAGSRTKVANCNLWNGVEKVENPGLPFQVKPIY